MLQRRARPLPDIPAATLVALTVVSAIANQVWAFIRPSDQATALLLDDLLSPLPWLFAAMVCLYSGWRIHSLRRPWWLFGMAAFSYCLGDSSWLVLVHVFRQQPFPSLADLFYLGFIPLFALGVLNLPRPAFRRMEATRAGLNIAIVVIGLGTFSWRFALASLVQQSDSLLGLLIALAYPIGDLVLFSLVLLVASNPATARLRTLLYWLVAAVVCQMIADISFTVATANGIEEGYLFFNPFFGWCAVCLALATAGSLRVSPVQRPRALQMVGPQPLLAALAPFIAIIGTFSLLLLENEEVSFEHRGTYVGAILVVIFVMLRQGAAFADNARLTRSLGKLSAELEQRVQERTQEIQWNATHDPLTRLPNRTMLQQRLKEALSFGPVAVLFIDLDGFKRINDTLGHAVGDELLRAVAERLGQWFHRSELIARTGGDEFVVIMPQASATEAEQAGRQVIHELEQPFRLHGLEFSISASVGYSLSPNDGEDAETLQRYADAAMYTAKGQGNGHVQGFTAAIKAQLEGRLEIEQQLKFAIARQELELHYQPIVDAKTGRIQTLEALLRWNNAVLGRVSPQQFIPIAEESGQISALSSWVLKRACAQNVAWQKAGLPKVKVAVNISMLQIGQFELAQSVADILEETGLEPQWLQLELIETALAQPHTASVLAELRSLGLSIAVDDFGTGYSSLSYLNHLPIDTLKIAQAFTAGLYRERDHSNAAALLEAIIGVTKSLKLQVTTEGIETLEQLELVQQLGCHTIQGYIYAKPAPSDVAAGWLETGILMPRQNQVA